MMSDCIEWTQCRDERNYGVSWYQRKKIGAHRKAWIIENGPIPEGRCVLHKCDNPPCVNVEHLFLGTHGDNMRDRFAKGRARLDGKKWRGGAAKVTEDDVPVIRTMRGVRTQKSIAEMYGICQSAVSRIMTGSNWGDIK